MLICSLKAGNNTGTRGVRCKHEGTHVSKLPQPLARPAAGHNVFTRSSQVKYDDIHASTAAIVHTCPHTYTQNTQNTQTYDGTEPYP